MNVAASSSLAIDSPDRRDDRVIRDEVDSPAQPDTDDFAAVARLLLSEAHLSLVRAEGRVQRIETKASWLLSGLLAAFGLVAIAVGRQASGVDFDEPVAVIALCAGGAVMAMLLAAAYHLSKVIDLGEFQLPQRDWLKLQITEAEAWRGSESAPLTLGMAHTTLTSADSSADRANEKIQHFRPAMLLIRCCIWGVVPYCILLLVDVARNTPT